MSERKYSPAEAYAITREMVSHDPSLTQAIVSGIVAGVEAQLEKVRAELSWSNMAMDMALLLATQRVTPALKEQANFVIQKRLEAWGPWANQLEKEWLEKQPPAAVEPP